MPIRIQRATVQTVVVLLLAGTPLLLAAVALAVWVLVGRALRSVEQIRTTVAEIDARALTARLEVPQTRDEIAALAQTMNAMLDRLQASDKAQRAFVSDASHELRSPLATLSTAAELAGRTTDEEVRTRLLDTMNAELVRMRGLVGNLMALARADAHDAATSADRRRPRRPRRPRGTPAADHEPARGVVPHRAGPGAGRPRRGWPSRCGTWSTTPNGTLRGASR